MKKTWSLSGAFAVLMVLATACGEAAMPSLSTSTPAATPSPAPTAAPSPTFPTPTLTAPTREPTTVHTPISTPSPAPTAAPSLVPTPTIPPVIVSAREVRSEKIRVTSPEVLPADLGDLVAGNSAFAFDLYQALRAEDDNLFYSPYSISLALAISESEDERFAEQELTGRILARVAEVLDPVGEPSIERLVRGLLAEKSGQLVEAGRLLSAALGEAWELPSADRRRAVVSNLHNRAVKKLHELYEATPTRRRAAAWAVALPNVWKHRSTQHFDVSARSDLVSEYVAEALEYHFNGIAKWLGVKLDNDWTPRCEIRVYARLDAFHAATETSGVTRAVSLTRVQGQRVLARKISVIQSDPWLLSSTLPHELTHILLVERLRATGGGGPAIVPPFALDEGLAVQAEPAARRLQYRRLLVSQTPNPLNLMKIGQIIGDQASFYARSGALAEFILQRKGMSGLLEVCRQVDTSWWESLDWPTKDLMLAEWKPWYVARRDPPRMPLMILIKLPDGSEK